MRLRGLFLAFVGAVGIVAIALLPTQTVTGQTTQGAVRADGGAGAGGVAATRAINTTAPLAGGGDLSADRTLSFAGWPANSSGVLTNNGSGTLSWGSAGVASSRAINTTAPLSGGGDLSADRTIAFSGWPSNSAGVLTNNGSGTLSWAAASSGDSILKSVFASAPAASNDGNLQLYTDSAFLNRDTGSVLEPWGPIYSFTDPTTPSWAWNITNGASGSATVATTKGGITLYDVTNGTGNFRVAGRDIAAPSTPYTITAAFVVTTLPNSTATSEAAGLYWRDSGGTPKYAYFGVQADNSAAYLGSVKLTSATAWSANYKTVASPLERGLGGGGSIYWMQISDTGTNRICRWSRDGQNWIVFHSVGNTDHLTPTRVGFFVSAGADYDINLWLLSWKQT